MRGIVGAAGALVLVSTVSSANAATMCGGFANETPEAMKTGRIVGQGPAKFQNEVPSQCKTVDRSCWTYGHPVAAPGERIAVFEIKDGYVCAEAETARRSPLRRGWLPAQRVLIDPQVSSASQRWWGGVWSTPGETITITLNRTELHGTAKSPVEDGAGRYAEFDGPLTRVEGHLSFIDPHYGCEVQLSRMGSALAVSDNARCGNGGRLTGIYHR